MRPNTVTLHVDEHGEVQYALTDDSEAAAQLQLVADTCKKVTSSAGPLFIDVDGVPTPKGQLGRDVIRALGVDIDAARQHFPMHRLTPLIEIWDEAVEELALAAIGPALDFHYWPPEAHASVFKLIEVLREAGREPRFVDRTKRRRRRLTKNHRELLRYVDAQIERHRRLLAIRLDLGYRKPNNWPHVPASGLDAATVKRHWKKLRRHALKNFPITGFVWKLEAGLLKGFHFHVLILLNGDKVRNDIGIAQEIGRKWQEITEGLGLYFNCNAGRYVRRGVGMIDYRDAEKIENLKRWVVPYLTKVDLYVELAVPGLRTFGKGNMPSLRSPQRRGRPRRGVTARAFGPTLG